MTVHQHSQWSTTIPTGTWLSSSESYLDILCFGDDLFHWGELRRIFEKNWHSFPRKYFSEIETGCSIMEHEMVFPILHRSTMIRFT